MKYGFPVTEYFDLVAASKVLDALKTVWKSTEDWETMYTRYGLFLHLSLNHFFSPFFYSFPK